MWQVVNFLIQNFIKKHVNEEKKEEENAMKPVVDIFIVKIRTEIEFLNL